jgi:hypothetical protein
MGPPRKASLDINGRVTAQQKGKGRDLSPNGVRSSPATTNGVDGNGLDSTRKYGLEAKPGLDVEKAEELCGIEEGQAAVH